MSQRAKFQHLNQITQANNRRNAPEKNSWDHLLQISEEIKNQMLNVSAIVLEARDFLQQNNQFKGESVVLVDGILASVERAATSWRQAASRHVGRTGACKDAMEHSMINDIGMEYFQAHELMLTDTSRITPRLQEIVTVLEYHLKGVQMVDPTLQDPTARTMANAALGLADTATNLNPAI